MMRFYSSRLMPSKIRGSHGCRISPKQQSQTVCVEAEGFTLVEVFVAILIAMISLSVSLQMYITAKYLQNQSTQFGEAYNWIREDYEVSRSKAEAFEHNVIPYSSYCGQPSNNALAARFIANTTSGLGGATSILGPRNLSGKNYSLTRSASYATSAAPDRLVKLNYVLMPTSGGTPEVEFEAEVVVYSAFKCPA